MLQLDKTDVMILKALQNNAKINMKELCAELNISKTPVYERIRRLEEEGYIKELCCADRQQKGRTSTGRIL